MVSMPDVANLPLGAIDRWTQRTGDALPDYRAKNAVSIAGLAAIPPKGGFVPGAGPAEHRTEIRS